MSPWLPRLPARAGLDAARPAARPVARRLADELTAAVGVAGRLERLGEGGAASAYYRLRPAGGGQALFVKIVPAAHGPRQRAAGALARFLDERGVATSPVVPGFPKPAGDGRLIFAHRFVDGRPIRARPAELRRLGATIARLHAALADWPGAAGVKRAAARRRKLLAEAAGMLARAGADRHAAAARRALAAWPDAFAGPPPGARMVHGDLNPGNVIVRAGDGAPVLLDFEEALHSWLAPEVDLALPLERLVLLEVGDDARAARLGQALLESYRAAGGRLADRRGWLAETLTWLALRSLALLGHFDSVDTPWPDTEWTKFFRLLDLHRDRRDVIDAIERGAHA